MNWKKRVLRASSALLLSVSMSLVPQATPEAAAADSSYDAFVDFSFASNPTPGGLWRYGFTPPATAGPLTLYTHRDSLLGVSAWRDATDPNVIKNETGSDLLLLGAIQFPATEFLHFHPGPSGERSVVRWTAPATGAYQIAASFRGLRTDSCGQTVDVHVLHNGTELYRSDIFSRSDVRSFLGARTVNIGDTVDFQVGRGSDSYVCDSTGLKATITRLDVDVDVTRPVVTPPASVTAEATSAAGATVTYPNATATDNVGVTSGPTCSPASGSVFPLGTTTVTCTAKDAAGNTGSASFTVTVQDTTPPAINSVSASPNKLWLPNHKMVKVTVSVSASDLVDASPSCTITGVTSNEPVDGLGDGDTAPDWEITGALTVNLRAERSGTGDGRVYTITVTCTDDAGNSATKSVTVSVPKSQAGGRVATES